MAIVVPVWCILLPIQTGAAPFLRPSLNVARRWRGKSPRQKGEVEIHTLLYDRMRQTDIHTVQYIVHRTVHTVQYSADGFCDFYFLAPSPEH